MTGLASGRIWFERERSFARICALLAFIACGLQMPWVFAAEIGDVLAMRLEELRHVRFTISGSSFFEQDVTLTPGYSTVFEMSSVEESGSRTLGEALSSRAPGLNVSRHSRQGVLVGVRGIMIDNNAKTNVMLDGHSINQRVHFGSMIPLDSPLLGGFRRTEVSLSPGVLVHGSGTINGFVNLIPRNGTSDRGTIVGIERGVADDLYSADVAHGVAYGNNRDLFFYVGAVSPSGFKTDEFYGDVDPASYDVTAGKVKGFEHTGYRLLQNWNHDDFNLLIFFDDLSPYNNSLNESENWHQTMLTIRPKYQWRLDAQSSLELKLGANWFDYGPEVNGRTFSTSPTLSDRGGAEENQEVTLIYRSQHWSNHQFAIGGEAGRRKFHHTKRVFRGDAISGFESADFNWRTVSGFAEDIFQATDRISLTYGLRYDRVMYGTFCGDFGCELRNDDIAPEGHWSPRLAVAYSLDSLSVLKLSYQHGFRYPDGIYHLWKPFWEARVPGAGDDIKSERMDSLELNLHRRMSKTLDLAANLYRNWHKDTLSFVLFTEQEGYHPPAIVDAAVAAEGWYGAFVNSREDFESVGGELIANWLATPVWSLTASYGYNRLLNAERAQERFPRHLIKLNSTLAMLRDKLRLSLDLLFNSGYNTNKLALNPVYENSRKLVDLALNWDTTPDLTLQVSVNNVLEENTPSLGSPSDPSLGQLGENERRVYLQLKWRI